MFPPVPTDPKEFPAYQRACVDAGRAQRIQWEADNEVKRTARELKFDFTVHQQHPDWIRVRERFKILLIDKKKTPMEIFKENFKEAQILFLMPPPTDGVILDIQNEHTKEYKALLSSDRFRGVADNLATKLTMLHFGLPIEPLTLENVNNCSNVDDKGNAADKPDPPDTPEGPPRVQRIMWAEKPLEFLDKYDDGRSYGYPKLRSEF